MKLSRIRALVLAVVSAGLAAAVLGPMAGPASAAISRPKVCNSMMDEVYEDWGLADIYANEAREAGDRGDWLGAAVYNHWASEYEQDGDALYDHARGLGC